MTQKHSSSTHESLWLEELLAFSQHSRILQKWRPVSYLDKGQFSRIFKAVNPQTGEEAVVKFVPTPLDVEDCIPAADPAGKVFSDHFEMSKREAEIMSRLRGENNVVQYLEEPEFLKRTFRNPRGEMVVQYALLICMPLYRSHREWLELVAGNRRLSLQVGLDIAKALTLFERKGIFHRDIKPGNIMMSDDGCFCLGDVGESKMEYETTTVGWHGTRPYMAPEVYKQEHQHTKMRSDHRSDIYSLGIVLYRLFNHQQFPFLSEDGTLTKEASRIYKQYAKSDSDGENHFLNDSERARILRYKGDRLPLPIQADEQLAKVILRACAYDKKDRYQTAEELYDDLLQCLEEEHRLQRGKSNKNQRRRGCMKTVILVCFAGTLVAGSLVLFALLFPPKPPVPPTSTPTYTSAVTRNFDANVSSAAPTQSPEATPPTYETIPSELVTNDGFTLRLDQNGEWTIYEYSKDEPTVIIPAEVMGRPVTQISSYAFRDCWNVQNVVIPDSVTAIRNYAFQACDALQSIRIPSSVVSFGKSSFDACSEELIFISEEGSHAAAYASAFGFKLEAIPVPKPQTLQTSQHSLLSEPMIKSANGLILERTEKEEWKIIDYIGEAKNLVLPDEVDGYRVTAIGSCVFEGQSQLETVWLGEYIETIGDSAFFSCSNLTEVRFSANLKNIDMQAFYECRNLQELYLPDEVTYIKEGSFFGCTSLESIRFPAGLTYIEPYAFAECSSLRTVDLPVGLISIGEGAFSFCSLLEKVHLPQGLLLIGSEAFAYCPNLHGTMLPSSVISISEYAFSGCADDFAFILEDTPNVETEEKQEEAFPSTTIRGWDEKQQRYQYVSFGAYSQTNSIPSPILWRVLSKDGNYALLLSEYTLAAKPFDDRSSDWNKSDLRAWLNETFAAAAFGEKNLFSTLIPFENSHVFLLSAEDFCRPEYGFNSDSDTSDPNRFSRGTEVAVDEGLWVSREQICTYYTQTAEDTSHIKQIRNNGTLGVAKCSRKNVGVRPAVLVDLTKVKITSGRGTTGEPYMLEAQE